MGQTISLSDAAAARISKVSEQGTKLLRLVVNGGGCSGFQYDFALTDAPHPDDLVVEHKGARLAVDVISLPLLAGSQVDFKDELAASRFVVNNPNATMGCGCGVSFSV